MFNTISPHHSSIICRCPRRHLPPQQFRWSFVPLPRSFVSVAKINWKVYIRRHSNYCNHYCNMVGMGWESATGREEWRQETVSCRLWSQAANDIFCRDLVAKSCPLHPWEGERSKYSGVCKDVITSTLDTRLKYTRGYVLFYSGMCTKEPRQICRWMSTFASRYCQTSFQCNTVQSGAWRINTLSVNHRLPS